MSLSKYFAYIHKDFFPLGSVFHSMFYISMFMPVPHCFDDRSLPIDLEIIKYKSFNFFLLQEYFAYFLFLEIPYRYYNGTFHLCFISFHHHWNFDKDCIKAIDFLGWY